MANRYWVGGTGTWTTTTTNWSASSGGSSGASAPTAADSVFFDQAGTYTVTMTGALTCLDITVSAGTVTFTSTGTLAISGSMLLVTGTIWSATGTITFNATTAKTITTNAVTILSSITLNGVGGTWQLQDALTLGATRTLTLTNGTLDLNGKTLTTGLFSSTNANARTIAFGTGNIVCNNAGGTLWTTATVTNLTVTGTPVVNISNSGAVATTVASGILTEANSISFNFTTGTYVLTFLATASYSARNIDFTGFAGRWAAISNGTIYGNLTISTGMTLTASVGVLRFGATSGTQLITTSAKTFDFPVTFNGVGGTFKLLDALTMGATRVLTFTNGTFDGDNKTISGASSISLTGTVVKNILTAVPTVTTAATAVTMGGPNTFGTFGVFDAVGVSINISSYQLTCTSFSSTGSSAKTLSFGGGNITCNGAGGTLFAANAAMATTGTPIVNIVYSGASAVTINVGSYPEAQAFSFNFTAGTYALTFLGGAANAARNIDFTGFAGNWNVTSTATIYGNLTISTGMTLSASASVLTFGATSGTQLITSNGKTQDKPLTIDGVGGTIRLADALLMGTARAFTHTNGTLDLDGKTLTVGATYATAAGTKDITFNGGTLVCPAVTVTAFNNAVPTGFTTTAGTGTGKISMTGATAKTFVGGGATYNCTLSNDGAGALTVSGSNTFTAIANGVQPTAFTFTASTTQTVTDWNVSGTAGNLVTIISSTAGTPATLSKASGTVISSYVSLKDSAATGGASWYAAVGSTNVSGNSGWVFGVAKYWVGGTGNWSTAARWATSSGGGGGSGITPADSATFDVASGGGTSTVDSNVSVQTLTMTGYTGTLAFGTNTISLLSSGNVYTGGATYSVSGTPVINLTYSGSVSTSIAPTSPTEANSISFNITSGTYVFDISGGSVLSLNFTGFSGAVGGSGALVTVYGDFTLSPTCTFPTAPNYQFSFRSTSATTRVITTNGIILGTLVIFSGTGGSWRFADAFKLGTNKAFTLANGTIDLNGKNITVGPSQGVTISTTNTKNITFNGGSIYILTSGATAFNVTGPTGFTTTAGTGTGYIRMTNVVAKTFVGGGSTFNCILSNDAVGALTITGSNTFTSIANGVQPTTFTFTAGTTQTITNWNLNGTAGNLVTINSSIAGVPALLSKASGTVSSDYLSLKDSTALGGAAWYAGANSTNVSGNLGWIFTAPPATSSNGNFFFMF